MSFRDGPQAAEELAIFRAFLRSNLSLGREIVEIVQPSNSFPDITAKCQDGSQLDFELSEWLDGEQMQQNKRIERLESYLLDALGEQGSNVSEHFRCVMLVLRDDAGHFDLQGDGLFRSELLALCGEINRRWPLERHWRSSQGHVCRNFETYPTLAKYLASVHFSSLRFGDTVLERWPAGQPWIFFRSWGGSYSSNTALNALLTTIRKKQNHYDGETVRHVHLLIYYGQAVRYNTPYYGVEFRGFEDVARFAADALTEVQMIFEKVYLLQALEPDLQAFEIYPKILKCH